MSDAGIPQADVIVFGFSESIYTQVVCMALAAKKVRFELVHDNPFDAAQPDNAGAHPFKRVPVLRHGDFVLYEAAAITRYVARAFEGPDLMPSGAAALARMDQVIAIADSYAYWPMVRQAYAHRVVRAEAGEVWEREIVKAGMAAAQPVLAALEEVAREGLVLNGLQLGLADCQLAPMMAAFAQVEGAQEMLDAHPSLNRWLEWVLCSRAWRTTQD